MQDTERAQKALDNELPADTFASFQAMPIFQEVIKDILNYKFESEMNIERIGISDKFRGPYKQPPTMRERLENNWDARIRGRTLWNDVIVTEDRAWLAREGKNIQTALNSASMFEATTKRTVLTATGGS